MTRILFVANYASNTGFAWNNIYGLFFHLAENLTKFGVGCYISYASVDDDVDLGPFSRHYLQFDPYNKGLKNTFRLLWFVLRHRIQGVYFTDQRAFRFLYFLLRCVGVKSIVVHCRAAVPESDPFNPGSPFKRTIKTIMNRMPWFTADKVYAVSGFLRKRLIEKGCFPEEKVVRILNGIDMSAFAPREEYRDRFPVEVFVCGRASHEKGIDVLIRAMAHLRDRPIKVDYFGDGPCLDEYKKLVADLGLTEQFVFRGLVPSTRLYVNQYDIAVVPSRFDAGPSTVSEAMASGVPVVTTRTGGIPELLGHDDNGLLVDPGDAVALADALKYLASNFDLRIKYRNNSRARAEQHLSLTAYYNNVLQGFIQDFQLKSKVCPSVTSSDNVKKTRTGSATR